ncbi:App1 family protein [soil metagenome]
MSATAAAATATTTTVALPQPDVAGSGWERLASRALRSVERQIDGRLRPGERVPRRVVTYRGFGNADEVFVMGRVLADDAPRTVTADASWWHNLAAAYGHLESDEVTGARVRLSMHGAHVEAVTDDEGYYRAWLRSPEISPDVLWHAMQVTVDAPRTVSETGLALVPTAAAELGVISDLDDTVIRTDATRLLSMLKRTLLDNAHTRLPFPGVAEFYSGLHDGTAGDAANPIFYVSSSPWNLYPVLTEFLEHQSVPMGPLMLRDWGISEHGILPTRHGEHKLGAIRQILGCYPHLPFILIGDSGQEDPEIYRQVVHEFGARILAVYIRDVSADAARSGAIGRLSEEVRAAGSDLLLSTDTLASARHAAAHGWLSGGAAAAVLRAVSPSSGRPG